MDHSHDHAHHQNHVDVSTTTMMNHAHHMMNVRTNSTSIPGGHGSHANHMTMSMTFHTGFNEKILFEQWNPTTITAFIGSWLVIFFVAVLYEGLKTIRDNLAKRDATCPCTEERNRQPGLLQPHGQPEETSNRNDLLPGVRTTHNCHSKRHRMLSSHHIVQTLLHILQMGISYLLMLVAMTFNVYLFLAVILGAGLGHFLFGWRRSSVIDYNEHCH